MTGIFIVKRGASDHRELVTIVDDPKTETVVLNFIRAGCHVDFRTGADLPAAPERPRPAIELVSGRVKRQVRGRPRGSSRQLGHIPGAPKWAVGDSAYLAWSQLDDDQRLWLSKYRNTKAAIVEKRPGYSSTGVRFNGNPDTIWLKPIQLASAPEVD